MVIRRAEYSDARGVNALSQAIGLFTDADEIAMLVDTPLRQVLDGDLDPETHRWLVEVDDSGCVLGAAFYAPDGAFDDAAQDPHTLQAASRAAFNLYFIGVLPSAQRSGTGSRLLRAIEDHLQQFKSENSNLLTLVVETGAGAEHEAARKFYLKHGFAESGYESDAYGPGEDKVVFRKDLEGKRG